jgi:hypothetical protein
LLTSNPYKQLHIKRISVDTQLSAGRSSAEIEAVELDSETYEPGDIVKATAIVRPYKEGRRRVSVQLKLPVDLPEGQYTATVCDDLTNARFTLRGDPNLYSPSSVAHILGALKLQTGIQRNSLVLRVPLGPNGVAAGGKALPDLPASMVHILANSRRTGAQPIAKAAVARQATEWVIQGAETVRFNVVKTRKVVKDIDW